jgi:glycine reductase
VKEALMGGRVRLVHYMNQFFAGIGGEKAADLAPGMRPGPIGPGRPLQEALGEAADLVATVYCGDDYFHARREDAVREIVSLVADAGAHGVVTGPAFGSGRYGVACGAVAEAVESRLGIPAVTAMSPDNPGAELHRRRVVIVPTGESAGRMTEVLGAMARLVLKRIHGEPLDAPEREGYLPRGVRRNVLAARTTAERAVDLVLRKVRGEPYASEIPFPTIDRLVVARLPGDPATATIALVTSGGVVPRGNPDRIEARRASRWTKFSIAGVEDLTSRDFECVHGGFDHDLIAEDPDRVLPVDAMRALEREGRIGRLHEYCYVTVGAGAALERARRFGQEIATELLADGVSAAVMTAT